MIMIMIVIWLSLVMIMIMIMMMMIVILQPSGGGKREFVVLRASPDRFDRCSKDVQVGTTHVQHSGVFKKKLLTHIDYCL